MSGIVERLRSLIGGGTHDRDTTRDDDRVEQEQAIEAVDAARETAQVDALFAMTDAPGSVDAD
ncbi:MAG: hypothetical protein MUE92_06725 [Chloroflexi bacterium]|jgi:hypothetical protein|nr:hypothetical protein [Chloroflexota bacterium]